MQGAADYVASAIEREPADLELLDPEPIDAREALRDLLDESGIEDREIEGIVAAVSETVTNAHFYGRPPVLLRAWRRPGRAVVTISDGGDGPPDPDVGLRPAEREIGEGGLGLWMARQMCDEVVLGRHPGGFTIRVAVGSP